jgi:hypothetical protein
MLFPTHWLGSARGCLSMCDGQPVGIRRPVKQCRSVTDWVLSRGGGAGDGSGES